MVKSVLRIVLVGKTGNGKSVSGNKILGRTAFESEKDIGCVTKFCQEEFSSLDGRHLSVFDTPDVFAESGPRIDREIERLKMYIADGPCAILQVISLDSWIEESLTVLEKYEELLGEKCFGNGLILFTSYDECGSSIENWTNKYPNLLTALGKYENGYHVISNFATFEDKDQVKKLLLKIESILTLRAGDSSKKMGEKKNVQEKDIHLRERRILLLGKTGVGKSATGNTILGMEVFESFSGFSTVTRQCQKGSAEVDEWSVTVVDSPDFLYATHAEETEDVSSEIEKSLSLCTPGPHTLLLVFPMRTFTEQEHDVVSVFEKVFGKAARQYTMVVFTHGDELHGTTIEKLIEKNENVRDLLHQCGGRHHVFNNMERNNLCQVIELLKKVDQMVADNEESCYTIDMFHEAEATHKEEWEMMLMELDEEKRSDLKMLVREAEGVQQKTEERNRKQKERLMKEESTKRETEWETQRKARVGKPAKKAVGRMWGWFRFCVFGLAGIIVGIAARRFWSVDDPVG